MIHRDHQLYINFVSCLLLAPKTTKVQLAFRQYESAENEPKLYICRLENHNSELKDPLKLCRAEENCRGEWSSKSTDSKWSKFWNNLERWQNSVTSHRCTSVGPDASFFIKYLSMRIWLFLHRVDLCVAFYIWQDIHWVLYNALALVLLPIWCLMARVCFSCPAVIEVFQVCMSLAYSLSAKIFMAEECQVSPRRDKLLLAMLLLLAEAEWYERKCQRRRPLHPGKVIFMKVCKSALCLLLVIYDAILNNDGRWMKNDLRLACCLCWNILWHFEKRMV